MKSLSAVRACRSEFLRHLRREPAPAVTLLVLLAVGFLPLCGGPTYEFALITGLLVPTLSAVVAARRVSQDASLAEALRRGGGVGLRLSVAVSLAALVHAVRVGLCAPFDQAVFFFLGPICGTSLAGQYGAAVARVAWRWTSDRKLGLWAAALGPLIGVLISLARYYTSPIIFAFDPFVGFFSGTVYDTIVAGTPRLLTYRLGHLGLLAGLWLLAAPAGVGARRVTRVIAGAAFVAYGATLWQGPSLGHYQTDSSLRQTLGGQVAGPRCTVVFSFGIPKEDAARVLAECHAHILEQETYFDTKLSGPLTVFLFRNAAQKARLMGARHVYIAKPWRREVYVQAQAFPHPVLGHEIAHVVAGEFGTGPFRIAGPLGGLVPDPGRIEGFAVAASPRWDDDYTAQTWAAALLALGKLPPLEALFRLGFLGRNSSAAYTVSGAFVEFVRERFGVTAAKAWYGGAEVEEAFGVPLSTLDHDFRLALAALPVSDALVAVARARFERPAVFARVCPHQVDQLLEKAGAKLGLAQPELAASLYREALRLAPGEYGARLGLASCDIRGGALLEGERALDALLSEPWLSTTEQLNALEVRADLQLRDGRYRAAAAGYARCLELAPFEDAQRTLTLKRLAATSGGLAADAVVALLVGEPTRGSEPLLSGALLAQWADSDAAHSWVAAYLVGKNLSNRGRFQAASEWLDRALLARGAAPEPLFERALERAALVARCALGDTSSTTVAIATQHLARHDVQGARRAGISRFLARCGIADAP